MNIEHPFINDFKTVSEMNRRIVCFVSWLIFLFPALVTAADLTDLSVTQLLAMQKENALVIDVRTEQEWQDTGTIPGSSRLEFFNADGEYNMAQWLQQLNAQRQSPEQAVILVCRSGNRSRQIGTFLTKEMGMKNIYHLEHGMNAWLKQGKPTETTCPDLLACKAQ